MLYKKTRNLRACQLLLGLRKLESTVRYLGIEVDDAFAMSEQVDLCDSPAAGQPRALALSEKRSLQTRAPG